MEYKASVRNHYKHASGSLVFDAHDWNPNNYIDWSYNIN